MAASRSAVSVRVGQTCGVAKRTLVPRSAAARQSSRPSSMLRAPSSPDGTTWEWRSQNIPPRYPWKRGLFGPEIKTEVRRGGLQLAERTRFELTNALAGDTELASDFLEGLRHRAGEPETQLEHMTHAVGELVEGELELDAAQELRENEVRLLGVDVLEHVAVDRVAVADRRLEAHGILDEVEELVHAFHLEPALLGDLMRERFSVQLLREDAAGTHHPADLVDHVDRQANRPALVRDRARDGLADPPRRVRRKLVAHLVVELLDRPDQAEVSLLDQIEERDARVHVVARDRHDEPEVRLDQLLLGLFVSRVLAPGELSLFLTREQRAVSDLADVELQWILRGSGGKSLLGLFLLVLVDGGVKGGRIGDELELRLLGFGRGGIGLRSRQLGDWALSHVPSIGLRESGLEKHLPIRGMLLGGARTDGYSGNSSCVESPDIASATRVGSTPPSQRRSSWPPFRSGAPMPPATAIGAPASS